MENLKSSNIVISVSSFLCAFGNRQEVFPWCPGDNDLGGNRGIKGDMFNKPQFTILRSDMNEF